MSDEIKEKEEYEKYARDHRKELDAQEVKIGDAVKVLVGQFAGETGIVVGIIACDKSDYTDPYYEIALNCEAPEKYKCRKTLVTPNNVAGGFSAHDFEVIGNRAPKQPSNEIKVGDNVRVSSKLPKIYERFGARIAPEHECKVIEIDEGMALLDSIPAKYVFLFPTKYLVKVVDEKDAKYTKTKGETLTFPMVLDLNEALEGCDCFVSIREQIRKAQRDMEENNKPRYVPKIMFNTEFWVKYEADLAKEIAVKVANKYNDHKQLAEYAVKVAKLVVEGLKRK